MKYVYLNNFRGFQDSLIPIRKVNFLVGENSTGKSSILSVMNLLASTKFWMNHEFFPSGEKCVPFSDIVSAHSNDKATFQIGIMTPEGIVDSLGSKISVYAILMEFSNNHGSPKIAKMYYLTKSHEVSISYSTKGISYTFRNNKSSIDNELLRDLLSKWSGCPLFQDKPTLIDHKEIPFYWRNALAYSIPFVEGRIEPKKYDKSLDMIFIPGFVSDLSWLAPIRTEPKRVYEWRPMQFSQTGEHTPYEIRKLKRSRTRSKSIDRYLSAFGMESGLFTQVKIKNYGKEQVTPFELHVELDGDVFHINNVGYGVSQVLSLIHI